MIKRESSSPQYTAIFAKMCDDLLTARILYVILYTTKNLIKSGFWSFDGGLVPMKPGNLFRGFRGKRCYFLRR